MTNRKPHGISTDASVRADFERAGVTRVLDETVQWLDALVALTQEGFVLSPRSVVETLVGLDYDPADHVYVIWRADGRHDFWTQSRKDRYLAYLAANARKADGFINQTRIMVYPDRLRGEHPVATAADVIRDDHIFHSLKPLHRPGCFLATPEAALRAYPAVAPLRFGYTLSVRHGYAVISVPFAEDLHPAALAPSHIGSYLEDHRDYDVHDGPMRAVVAVEPTFVRELAEQTRALLGDPAVEER